MRSLAVITIVFGVGCGATTARRVGPGGGGGGGDGSDMAVSFADDGGGGDNSCDPMGPPQCEGQSVVKTCRPDGTGWDSAPCPDGAQCVGGQCTCTPGDRQCDGQDIQVCGMDNMFHVESTCPDGTVCGNGLCGEMRCPDETVSTNPNALPTIGWPRFRHDNRNSGASPVALADMPKLKWKVKIGGATLNGALGGLGSGPVVNQNDIIFIGGGDLSNGGSLMSLDIMGKVLYTFPAQRGFGSSTPAVRADGTAYFASQNAKLYAVDPKGMQQWTYQTGSQADGDPIVTKDGNLIYSSDDGSLYALSPKGVLLWKSTANGGPGEVDGGLAETCDGKIIAAGGNGWYALDAKTGMTLWSHAATGTFRAILSSPVVTADGRVFGFDGGGQGIAFDSTGKVLWMKQIGVGGAGSSVGIMAGVLYTALNDGAIHAVDAATGNEKWKVQINNHAREIGCAPITDGNQRIYINSSDGFIYAFDTAGKQLWKLPHSGVDTSGATDIAGTMAIGKDGTLYVPGNDGILYAYQ